MEHVKTLLKTKAGKNGVWLYILQMFNTVLPVFTLPYITRILGAEQYGVFSLVLNIVAYLQVLVEYGFALSATRRVAINPDGNHINKLFVSVVVSRFSLFGIALVLSGIYALFADVSMEVLSCLTILSIGLIGYCFQPNWLFQGKQDMMYISISSIIARSFITICIFAFVNEPSDLTLYCILYSLAPIVSNGIGTVIAIKKYNIIWEKIEFKDITNALKDGAYIFFTQLSSKVFSAIGVTFLGIWSTAYYVGIFSAINKIPFLILLIWNPIAQIIYPITSRKINESFLGGIQLVFRIQKYCLIFFVTVCGIVAICAKPTVGILFGIEYVDYYYIVYPQLVWVLLGIINNFIGIQILIGGGYDKEYSKSFLTGVACTVVLNAVFIYDWGIIGAAFAPMISEAILTVLLMIQLRKIKKRITN